MVEKELPREFRGRGGARGPRRRERGKRDNHVNAKSDLTQWIPKTQLGKKVQAGEITSLDQMFDCNLPVIEPEVIDTLTDLEEIIVDVKKTTRVVMSGRKFSFRVTVLAGNKNGYIGIGQAKDREKLNAVKKAARNAKLSLVKIQRGCGSWECLCGTQHTVPFKVMGKAASVQVTLQPAPKGVGLVAGDNIKEVLKFAGIRDVWSQSRGDTGTKLNSVKAAVDALRAISRVKLSKDFERKLETREAL